MRAGDPDALQARIGYTFADREMLRRALTHRSTGGLPGEHNEILEFLGDSVLGLSITDLLVRAWPGVPEGVLSKRRAALVSSGALAERARALDLGSVIWIGRGEERTRGREKASILANALEAVLGAIYLDGGLGAARAVVERLFAAELREHPGQENREYKTRLQEITQRLFRAAPAYELVTETGPDHAKVFESRVSVAGVVYGTGQGGSKKVAEHEAARQALETLQPLADAAPAAGAREDGSHGEAS